MNPLRANFAELYERHLCRHSQFGINVNHFISLVGTYWALYGCAFALLGSIWPLVPPAAFYLGILAFNVPWRVFFVCVLFMAFFFAMLLTLPVLPFWVYLLTLYPFYLLQQWGHRIWDRAHDMTEFNRKYAKGKALFILLTVYELPIQLNFLIFREQAGRNLAPAAPDCAREPETVAGSKRFQVVP
jgi:hypothetical protein